MAALMFVDKPGYRALLLRRTFAQLSKGDALIPRSHEWLHGTDASWNEQKRTWTFPSGATVEFGHVEHETSKYDYQGAAFQFIGFDELTQFAESQYDYIGFSRARRRQLQIEQGVPIRTRATSNPGGEGHGWVKRRFIDDRRGGVVFVPARVVDNPGLDVAAYAESLAYLPDELRRQLLDGDWGAFEGAAFTVTDDHLLDGVRLEQSWQRFEGMDYGLNNPTCWHAIAVDYDGNLIFFDSYYQPGLPSETAPAILKLRQSWLSSVCWGDPNSLAMRTGTTRKFGDAATIETEFADNGVHIARGNDNPRAGYARLRELLKLDGERRFPQWHPRSGESGAPRMFVVSRTCRHLVEQLRSAPLQPIERRLAGEMVDPEWESRHGHAIAAARYAVLSRPSPSLAPPQEPDDPRRAWLDQVEQRERERHENQGRYMAV